MTTFLIYLLKVSAWFVPLYVLYLALYKRFTFFHLNRLYLLGIVLLSFVLPYIHYDIITTETISLHIDSEGALLSTINNEWGDFTEPQNVVLNHTLNGTAFSWKYFVFILYIIGAGILLLKLFLSLISVRHMINAARKSWKANLSLVYTTDKVPHSSFFHYIFLNHTATKDTDVEKIILHEMQHYEKLHTIDILFCEMFKIVFWFNPFVYWYKQSLQEVHEFEVDAEMTKLYNEVAYAELLVQVATNSTSTVMHQFSTKPLKTRLKMIFNHKTLPMKKLSFFLVLPLIAGLLLAYGNIQQKKLTVFSQQEKPFTILIDAGHGGADRGVINNDIAEATLNLTIANELKTKAETAGYKVIMCRKADAMVALKDRTVLAEREKVDLIISIHVNNHTDVTKNGIEFYAGKNNNPTYASPSILISKSIWKSLRSLAGISVNETIQSRDAGIWILKSAPCPSVLIECGYLSNSADFDYITKSENQQNMASKIIEGIIQYNLQKKGQLLPIEEEGKKAEPKTIDTKEPKNNSASYKYNNNNWLPVIKKDSC
jgi:N-acetylmuramoyl-L-alanine amidase